MRRDRRERIVTDVDDVTASRCEGESARIYTGDWSCQKLELVPMTRLPALTAKPL